MKTRLQIIAFLFLLALALTGCANGLAPITHHSTTLIQLPILPPMPVRA